MASPMQKKKPIRVLFKSRRYYKAIIVVASCVFFLSLLPFFVLVHYIPNNNNNNNSSSSTNNNKYVPDGKFFAANSSVSERRTLSLSPLQALDFEKYTVRVNTWKREKQLEIVLEHLLTCDSVLQIQVVWCTAQGPIPNWLEQQQQQQLANEEVKEDDDRPRRLVVEYHEDNSLNARFDVLTPTVTAGILNQDDDILRPCVSMDAGFAIWTANPHRMVGFDARSDGKNTDTNKSTYSYLSETQRTNQYSLTLTRFAFVHVDYLRSYTTQMPNEIRTFVAQNLNCEDIAMSLWVSSRSSNPPQPPLLADAWAMESRIKLNSDVSISSGSQHKQRRDQCVAQFAQLLHIPINCDGLLPRAEWMHTNAEQEISYLQCGAIGNHIRTINSTHVAKLIRLRRRWQSWSSNKIMEKMQWLRNQMLLQIKQQQTDKLQKTITKKN